jgi:hypothetical protein
MCVRLAALYLQKIVYFLVVDLEDLAGDLVAEAAGL